MIRTVLVAAALVLIGIWAGPIPVLCLIAVALAGTVIDRLAAARRDRAGHKQIGA